MNEIDDRALDPLDRLRGLDLNLMVAFDLLARERSVTRAAARLAVTQSAMSHTLRRLRAAFGDPLFVRARGGMAMTPRAESLIHPIRSGLVALGKALEPAPAFDPWTSLRQFRIVAPDLFELVALPSILARLESEAPGVSVVITPTDSRALADSLETGEVDLAVVVVPAQSDEAVVPELSAAGLVRRTLFRETLWAFARPAHPAFASPPSAAAYAGLRHMLVSPRGEGPGFIDAHLSALGLTRKIYFRTPSFAVAAAVTAQTDLILTASAGLRRLPGPLVAHPLPFEVPEHGVALVWHERFGSDPAHIWIRGELADAAGPVVTAAAVETAVISA